MSFSGNVTKIDGVVNGTHAAGQYPSDVRSWAGTAVGLSSGRPSVTADGVNDKTGYSLAAGSYAIRASSSQRGSVSYSAASGTITISSVTTTRASAATSSQGNTNGALCASEGHITASTTVTYQKGDAINGGVAGSEVWELV